MSELSDYYRSCDEGSFARTDPDECGCKGHGWFLSQLDTWHKCPAHWTKESGHPEDSE